MCCFAFLAFSTVFLEKMLERGSSETLLETEILGRVGRKMLEGYYYRIYEHTSSLL